jgi:ligand-binding sensor domain-containing protein/signal transduction histidine kinase
MAIRSLTLGLLLCAGAFALTPETEYSKRIWRSDDGLPQNKIQVITQTSDGYLWIGTSGGLVRFDGVRFAIFDRSNTPGLGDDSILSLCPARDGSLWIGTEGGGLVRMKGGALRTFGSAEGLLNPFVRALAEDRDGRLWVGTDRGFFRLEGSQMRRFDGRGSVPILAAYAIHRDRAGIVWVGTSQGLYRMEDDNMVPAFPASRPMGYVTAILEGPEGGLLLATDSGLRRVVNGQVETARATDPPNPRALWRDHEGTYWVGTVGAGLTRIGAKQTFTYRSGRDLPDNTVSSIFEDNAQNIWVGTQDGLLRMTRSGVKTITARDGLADDDVATVYQDPSGRLWIGTLTGSMYRLEGQRVVPVPSPIPGFRARGIYVDPAGVQWFSSVSQGFLRVEGKKARAFGIPDGMRSNNIRQFLYDRQGVVWIATGSGLTRYDHGSLRTFYLEEGLAYGGVRVLAEDRNGDILVGTDGGLNRVHNGVFVSDPVFLKLGHERVWAIHADSRGSLWLGTRGNGLVRIRDKKITRYNTRDGLLSNSIYQILDDSNSGKDRFWMSSPAGVFAADREELDDVADGRAGPIAVIPYGTDSGMLSSQMNGGMQSAGCQTRDGAFWFPSVKGAVRIDPLQLRVGPVVPVLVESLIADDKPLPISNEIVIPAGRGKLEIDYTSPDLLSPDRVTFRYRLEGFDEAWTPSPKGRAAYYTNLPPGRYRFHVVARDGARPDRTSEAILPIVWKPFFYRTLWFYAALAALTALIIFAVFRFYARQTKARYALVLAERTRLAREMHDTVIQGCVGVSTLLEAARSMPPSPPDSSESRIRPLLERAATQVRLTVNEAREAVWDLRHSDLVHSDPPADVVETLKSFASQVEAAEGIPVYARIEGVPASLGNTADRNLLLVAREAIRNAVSHAHPATIHVSLCFEPKGVKLEVNDDGAGFSVDKSLDNGHYGIIGMRERVEQSGGAFSVTSSRETGTHVVARIPHRNKHAERF